MAVCDVGVLHLKTADRGPTFKKTKPQRLRSRTHFHGGPHLGSRFHSLRAGSRLLLQRFVFFPLVLVFFMCFIGR